MIVLFPFPAVAAPQKQRITVCEFVRQIKALNGHIVSVRGVIKMAETDPDGATPDYLSATCSNLKKGIVEVRVEYPDVWFLKKPPKGYRLDKGSFLRAQKIVMSTLKDGKVRDRYIATITGLAFSPSPKTIPPPGIHITREGSYDAGIVIEGIYDLGIPAN